MRNISEKTRISIKDAILPEFDSERWSWLPTAICDGCYKDLRDLKNNPRYVKGLATL